MAAVHSDWVGQYQRVVQDLPALARNVSAIACLSNACVDSIIRLRDIESAVTETSPHEARDLLDRLLARATIGKGGELRSQWDAGPNWLRSNLACNRAIGGAGPQAAWVLSRLSVPAILALGARSKGLIGVLPPGVLVVSNGKLVEGRDVAATVQERPEITIVEFKSGERIAGYDIPRSTRVIVRFDDPGLEMDSEFEQFMSVAADGATALISGLGSVPENRIGAELSYLRNLVTKWRNAGLNFLHLELGDYDDKGTLNAVVAAAGGIADSLGMNASEFPAVAQCKPTAANMQNAAQRIGVSRLCVHADAWAASVTLNCPKQERTSLFCGSLLASARAELGEPAERIRVPWQASFTDPPEATTDLGQGWHFVSVATPYLSDPAATIGLGDTFSAGCLLVLSQPKARQNA